MITIDEILDPNNISEAMEKLLSKKDSCGVDNIFVSEFEDYWNVNSDIIEFQLRNNEYTPDIVLEREIVGYNGKLRAIALFTCRDRLILRAITQVLQPHLDAIFNSNSYAYRPNMGTDKAIKKALEYVNDGKVWVAELDIEGYFDSIDIDKLLEVLKQKVDLEYSLISLIKKYLYCSVESERDIFTVERGLIQGSPLSPLLANLFLDDLDNFLDDKGYSFIRYADDINIYCQDEVTAKKIYVQVSEFLSLKGLFVNGKKSGVYKAINRSFLGYKFTYTNKNKIIASKNKHSNIYYNNWHKSAIQKIDKNYHIVNDGVLSKRDFTLLFDNEEGKRYIPVETVDALNIYSSAIFTSNFFEFLSQHRMRLTVFDKYGHSLGSFASTRNGSLATTMLKQAEIYLDTERRLSLARKLIMAAMHNIRSNVRYYYKQKGTDKLEKCIDELTHVISEMNEAKSIDDLLLLEARGRQRYFDVYNEIITNLDFEYKKRTRRPPMDAINALISFGNTYMYNRVATEICKTSLDIRIGIIHSTTNRSESLNLDISELFKPLIVDRAIFTLINRKMIDANEHFEEMENGGIYLNNAGKRIFLDELERKIYSKLTIKGRTVSNDSLIREEVKKYLRVVLHNDAYKPYKYSN